MGKRRDNAFKRNDAVRALQSARDGGLEPAAMEVVLGPDGAVTFRILGDKAATDTAKDTSGTKAWNAEITKLKAIPKLHLKYVQSFGGYHYFRRRGSPRIPLPGVVGSAEFMEAYAQALAATPLPTGASKRS